MNGTSLGAGAAVDAKAAAQRAYNSQCNAVHTERRTPFHVVAEAQNEVDSLVDRICTLADRLVGFPPLNTEQVSAPQAPGIIGALEASAQCVKSRVGFAHAAIDKIEQELPT